MIKKEESSSIEYRFESVVSWIRVTLWTLFLVLFFATNITEILGFDREGMLHLLLFGLSSLVITHAGLWFWKKNLKIHRIIGRIRFGLYIVNVLWLILLTGGISSPFFPLMIFIVIHASVYRGYIGLIATMGGLITGYTIVLWIANEGFFQRHMFDYIINIALLATAAIFSISLSGRERDYRFKEKMILNQANMDALTGLYNRRYFMEITQEYAEQGRFFLLILGDIDDFKKINDNFGHHIGDQVLKNIGIVMKRHCLSQNGFAFRYGGEEFAVVLPRTDDETARGFIQSIMDEMSHQSTAYDNQNLCVTMSFGVTRYDGSVNVDDLLIKADKLMYQSKKSGKNQVCFDLN